MPPLLPFKEMALLTTWGDAEIGGDSTSSQDQLKGVRQIQASFGAFAAILSDGSVVAWVATQVLCKQS